MTGPQPAPRGGYAPAERLKRDKLVKTERRSLVLTEKGKTEAKRVEYNADAAGASYG